MLKEYLQLKTLSLVVIGRFNPAIIQPFWLAKKGLIKEQEASEAKVEIIHAQLTRYDLDWVHIEISENRFVFNSTKEPFFNPVMDLVEGIFVCLPETPITALGINYSLHFSIPHEKQYYEIGNRLTPFSNWNDVLDNPKMLDFSIVEQKRRDGRNGHYMVKIQPSDQVPKYGVLVTTNDHLAVQPGESETNGEIMTNAKEVWATSLDRTENIIEKLWKNLNI